MVVWHRQGNRSYNVNNHNNRTNDVYHPNINDNQLDNDGAKNNDDTIHCNVISDDLDYRIQNTDSLFSMDSPFSIDSHFSRNSQASIHSNVSGFSVKTANSSISRSR